jgi:hypothetical protein
MTLTTPTLGGLTASLSSATSSAATAASSAANAVSSSATNQTAAFSASLAKINNSTNNPPLSQAAAPAITTASVTASPLKASESVLKTVYDPTTGREFVSPVQALQYGVSNYVEAQPSGLPLLKSLSGYSSVEITEMSKQLQMSAPELINKERQGALRSADTLPIKTAVATESNGLSPSQLVEKLKAFKISPPTTAKQFQEQQGLWADYANRYANSSWNYANMDGKPQDHSLKPGSSLPMQFTGYSAPINQMLSNMNQQSPQFQEIAKALQKNPEVSAVVNELYSINPEQSFFNALNPKYAGGTPPETMASNFAVSLQNLSNKMDSMGKDAAMREFIGQQQNLLSVLPDEGGKLGNTNMTSMANPQYRAMQQMVNEFTPKVSDAQWQSQVALAKAEGMKVSSAYRDPESGKGVALQLSSTGQPEALRLYDSAGTVTVVYNDPAKLVEAVYEAGIPLNAFTELAKETGSDVLIPSQSTSVDGSYFPIGLEQGVKLGDVASGKLAQVVASEDWLNFKIADAKSKSSTSVSYVGGLNDQIAKIKNQNAIAKAFLSELKLNAAAPRPSNVAQLAATNQIATNTALGSTVDNFLGSIDAQLNYLKTSQK